MSHVCDIYVDLLRVDCIQGGVEIFLVNSLSKNQLKFIEREIQWNPVLQPAPLTQLPLDYSCFILTRTKAHYNQSFSLIYTRNTATLLLSGQLVIGWTVRVRLHQGERAMWLYQILAHDLSVSSSFNTNSNLW